VFTNKNSPQSTQNVYNCFKHKCLPDNVLKTFHLHWLPIHQTLLLLLCSQSVQQHCVKIRQTRVLHWQRSVHMLYLYLINIEKHLNCHQYIGITRETVGWWLIKKICFDILWCTFCLHTPYTLKFSYFITNTCYIDIRCVQWSIRILKTKWLLHVLYIQCNDNVTICICTIVQLCL
jgi:hypothetical protein